MCLDDTILYEDEIEDIQEECDGYSPSVSRTMVRERMQEAAAALLATLPQESRSRARRSELPLWRRQCVLEAYGGCSCVYCKAPNALAIDYLVPVSRGGSDVLHNLAPACDACTSDRCDTHLSDWFARRPDLDDRAIFERIVEASVVLRRRLDAMKEAA